jgi:hypothetical protein
LLVLAESSMDDAHVEEDLAGVGDLVKLSQSIFELVVVVATKGRNPGLDFLKAKVSMGVRRIVGQALSLVSAT